MDCPVPEQAESWISGQARRMTRKARRQGGTSPHEGAAVRLCPGGLAGRCVPAVERGGAGGQAAGRRADAAGVAGVPAVRPRHADRHLARGRAGWCRASRRCGPRRRADDARGAGRQRPDPPARAAAGASRAADRPSRHPQPRHHRRLAGLRRPRRRAAGLLRGAGGDDRRPRRRGRAADTGGAVLHGPLCHGARRQRADRRHRVPRRQGGRALRHPGAGAALGRLRHGRHRRQGEARRQHAGRAEPRLLRRRRQAGQRRARHRRRRRQDRDRGDDCRRAGRARCRSRPARRSPRQPADEAPSRPRAAGARAASASAARRRRARHEHRHRHLAHRQWRARRPPRRGAPASDRFPAPRSGPDGLAHRLRAWRMRRLHGARRRPDRARLPGAGGLARRRQGRDHRGRLGLGRDPRPAGGVRRPQRLPVRLLHAGHAAHRRRSAAAPTRSRRAPRSASTSPATTAAAPAITPSSMRSRRWPSSAAERPAHERDHRSEVRRPAQLLHRQVGAAAQCPQAGGGPRPVRRRHAAAAHGACRLRQEPAPARQDPQDRWRRGARRSGRAARVHGGRPGAALRPVGRHAGAPEGHEVGAAASPAARARDLGRRGGRRGGGGDAARSPRMPSPRLESTTSRCRRWSTWKPRSRPRRR